MKYKKITLICICLIIVLAVIYLFWNKNDSTESLEIYYSDEYIVGELISTEPMVNEIISLPIISNQELTDIKIIDIVGDNIDDLTITIESIPNQSNYYNSYVYKNIILRLQAYEITDEINIDKLNFEISTEGGISQVSIPFALTIKYDENIIKLGDFGTLKMFSIPPTLSDPNQFFTIRPNYNMKILNIYNNLSYSIKDIQIGISSSDDFNDINKTNLDTYNGNELNIDVLRNFNIFFYVNYQFEEYNYLGIIFPVIWRIELTNHEIYDILIMNNINLLNDDVTIRNYIENNFKEE